MKTTVAYQEQQSITTSEGEVIFSKDKRVFKYKIDKDNFYQTYIENEILVWKNIKSLQARNLLSYMCNNAEKNTGKVCLSRDNIFELEELFGKSYVHNIKRLYKELLEGKMILDVNQKINSYRINPLIFWNGDLIERTNTIKITYELL